MNSNNNFIVCLEYPAGLEFGIDYESFETGENFKGVKLVPSGLHFIFYSNVELGIRQGIFIRLNHRDIFVRQYSPQTEDLEEMSSILDEKNLADAVRNFQLDPYLGPYPQKHSSTWINLSNYISDNVLKRCNVPVGSKIIPGVFTDDQDVANVDAITPYYPDVGRTPCFTKTKASKTALHFSDPSELTKYNIDTSERIRNLVATQYQDQWMELLGEFQLSFVLFLLLSSFSALEQWKQMVWLLCCADELIQDQKEFYINFLKVLQAQLEQIPKDFFHDPLSQENFMKSALAVLMEILDSIDQQEITEIKNQLKSTLKDRFNIEYEIMGTYDFADDENAPALVMPYDLL